MKFTKQTNQHTRKNIGLLKGLFIFFLGMSCMFFMTEAFDIVPVTRNAVQYIQSIFLTQDGYSTSPQTIALNGADGSSYFEGDMTVDGNARVGPVLVGENPVSTNYKGLFDFNGYLSMASCSDVSHTCSFGGNFYGPLNNLVVDYVAGRVGIGTATPVYKLDVAGAVNGTSLCIAGDCRPARPSAGVTTVPAGSTTQVQFNNAGSFGASANLTRNNNILNIIGTGQASVLSAPKICLNGVCEISRPSGGTVIGGDSIWSTGTSNEAYYNSGNVGIGTGEPTAKLHVSTAVPEIMKITNTAASQSRGFAISGLGRFSIYEIDGGADPERLSIAAGGNVGIGTNGNATEKLHVAGKGKFDDNLIVKSDDYGEGREISVHSWFGGVGEIRTKIKSNENGSFIDFKNNLSIVHSGNDGNPIVDITPTATSIDTNNFYVRSGSNHRLSINASGNVGIGTPTPIRPLHVEGNMYVGSDSGNPTDEKILLQDNDYTYAIKNNEAGSFRIQQRTIGGGFSADKEIFSINKSGYVGIGITDPDYKLHVAGVGKFENNLIVDDKVGIGTNNPSAMLTVNGGIKPIGKTLDPCPDTTNYPEGTIFYNDSDDTSHSYMCFCNYEHKAKKFHNPSDNCDF